MEKKKVVILGGGHYARQLLGALFRLKEYEVIGFLDDSTAHDTILGVKRLGALFPIPTNLDIRNLVLGVGHVGKVETRRKIIDTYKQAGYSFETIICPTSAIMPYNLSIGEGVYIGDFAILSPNVTIADYAIINNTACINEGVSVGENSHVSCGVMLSGNVKIGKDCMIGTGATVLQGVTIGDRCRIGMGTPVVKNCRDDSVYSMMTK